MADPCPDGWWDISQHGGQGVPTAEETGGGLERTQQGLSEDVMYVFRLVPCVICHTAPQWSV